MNQRANVLDIASIIRILPHKPPAILVDQVLELNPGRRIVAKKNITVSEVPLNGHFPGLPVYPAAMIIEIMLQVCAILAYATDKFDPGSQIVTLNGVNKTKFHRTVVPGNTLEVEAELTQKRSNIWRFNVKCYVDDHVVVESGLVITVLDRADLF